MQWTEKIKIIDFAYYVWRKNKLGNINEETLNFVHIMHNYTYCTHKKIYNLIIFKIYYSFK